MINCPSASGSGSSFPVWISMAASERTNLAGVAATENIVVVAAVVGIAAADAAVVVVVGAAAGVPLTAGEPAGVVLKNVQLKIIML